MKKFIIISIISSTIISAASQSITSHRNQPKDCYNYWLYTPDTVKADTMSHPAVIFLHGASLCGTNLDRVRRYGTIDALEKGRKLDAYVIAPQNPGGAWNPKRVMNTLELVKKDHNIDTTRVYVMGMSLGGYGTIDIAATYPDKIAAAMAFCGGSTVKDLSGLNNVPLWIIHGTADKAVSVSQSDRVVSEMKVANDTTPRLIYNRVQGMNHSQPARLFYMPESYDWLMSHSLNDENRQVNEPFDISASALSTAYTGLKSNKKKWSKSTTKKNKQSKAKRKKKRSSTKR